MAVVAGCQEVQGACLEGCLGKACGGFGAFLGFEGFESGQTAALNALKTRWPWWLAAKRCKGPAWRVGLGKACGGFGAFWGFWGFEGFEGFESGQTAALNATLKTDGRGGWLPRGARGLLGGLPWKGLRRVWSIFRVWRVWERANGSLECP